MEVEAKDNSNEWTALHQAALSGHEAIARLLLKAKAKVDAKTKMGWTALQLAAQEGHEPLTQAFLAGVNPTRCTPHRRASHRV